MRKYLVKVGVMILGILFGTALVHGNCMAEKWPTFQVWGGSVFTYGNIEVSPATSRTMSNGDQFMFSSWVEQAVFLSNGYTTVASGAASSNGSLEDGKGGDFCKYRTPLSFANYSTEDFSLCPNINGQTGTFGYNLPRFNITASMEGLEKSGVTVSSSDETITGENGVRTVTGREVIATTGSVTIADNIIYNDDSKVYYSLEEVPKMLIYANDVNISCDVTRVDAIIFAAGTLNTCSDGPRNGDGSLNREAEAYSKQLVINGAIVAKTIYFNRTYGAVNLEELDSADDKTGGDIKSVCSDNVRVCASIPAEIVNYDNSILVMGKDSNKATTKTNLVTVYQRELAPRY